MLGAFQLASPCNLVRRRDTKFRRRNVVLWPSVEPLGFHLPSGVCRLFSLGLCWLLSHAAPATSTPQPSLLTSREMECSWLNGLGSEWQLKHMSVALTNISFSLLHSHSHFYFLFKGFFLSFRHSGYARNLYLFSDGVSP